jgi:hypothetical protein
MLLRSKLLCAQTFFATNQHASRTLDVRRARADLIENRVNILSRPSNESVLSFVRIRARYA